MNKAIETIVEATTELIKSNNLKESRLVLSYEGKSSNVSSGSMFGGCQSIDIPNENPIDVLKKIVMEHNEWLDIRKDIETDVVHRLGLKFKNKVTLNGKEIIIDKTNSLSKWF